MMSSKYSQRTGSALLIVLGFLSFMVVSAVAYAVFMRAERKPSSALRRSVAVRHLVRAAVAQAMSGVDDALRSDTYPGRYGTGKKYLNGIAQDGLLPTYVDAKGNRMNNWYARVFMPPDPDGNTDPSKEETRFAPISHTVSVLNLEALGYLPPGLMSDVRFLSRCSWTSKWQNFLYDAGRYAYTVVDVSDYFDINTLYANRCRTSHADSLISLTSCFKDSSGEGTDTAAATQFDMFVHQARTTDGTASSTMPFTSMMDYALGLGKRFGSAGFGSSWTSPFYTWITEANRQAVYNNTLNTNEGSIASHAFRQRFITDSWFPRANDEAETNLFYEIAQPFLKSAMDKAGANNLVTAVGNKTPFYRHLIDSLNYLNTADLPPLYDYLDRNDLPLSLNMPSTERIPMVSAIQVQTPWTVKFKVEQSQVKEPASPPPGTPYTQITTRSTKLANTHVSAPLGLKVLISFPFKYGKQLNSSMGGTFKATPLARIFYVAVPPGATNAKIPLRATGELTGMRPTEEEWSNPTSFTLKRTGSHGFVLNYLGNSTSLSLPNEVLEEEDAFVNNGAVSMALSIRGSISEDVVYSRVETVQMSASGTPMGAPTVSWTFNNDRRFYLPDGTLLPDASSDDYANYIIKPALAVWVKIETSDGVVDYVPATLEDDRDILGLDNSLMASAGNTFASYGAGESVAMQTPIIPFTDSSSNTKLNEPFTLLASGAGPAEWNAASPTVWWPKSYFTIDPRYNWAPEDWLPRDLNADKTEWLKFLYDGILASGGRDTDIFMGFSNQGYLQSIGELAMLPRLSDEAGAPLLANWGVDTLTRETSSPWSQIAHANFVWKTYPIDYLIADEQDKLFNQGIITDGGGYRINPYSTDIESFRAVIDHTPVDWWSAGTNTTTVESEDNSKYTSLKQAMLSNISTALKESFCADNPSAQLKKEDIDRLANYMRAQLNSDPNKTWQELFDNMPWGETQTDRLLGQEIKGSATIHSVDRKFLYAYWRQCFANKQQLFLIFVRAESNALGGAGEGTPAQQGARAVALVWRDPMLDGTAQDYKDDQINYMPRRPHKMRILFYHQFD